MRAIVFERYGDESVLHIGEAPSPLLVDGAVRIRVRATSVNRADLLQREGHYPPPPGASTILGLECAGEIAEIARGVSGWRIGDRAMALLPGGGYAEEVVADAGSVMRIPDVLSFEEAGAIQARDAAAQEPLVEDGALVENEVPANQRVGVAVVSGELDAADAIRPPACKR